MDRQLLHIRKKTVELFLILIRGLFGIRGDADRQLLHIIKKTVDLILILIRGLLVVCMGDAVLMVPSLITLVKQKQFR